MRMIKWKIEKFMAGQSMKKLVIVALRDGLVVLATPEDINVVGWLKNDCYKGEIVEVLIPEEGAEIKL